MNLDFVTSGCRLISKFSSATDSSLGSISTSLQIFINKFAVRSRKSLYRVNINPAYLQLIPCWIFIFELKAYEDGILVNSCPHLISCSKTAQKLLLSKIKPLIAIGYKVSQFGIPFSCEVVFKRLSLSLIRLWSWVISFVLTGTPNPTSLAGRESRFWSWSEQMWPPVWYKRRCDAIKTCRWIFFQFSLVFHNRKICKDRRLPYYFVSSRGQKIKNI